MKGAANALVAGKPDTSTMPVNDRFGYVKAQPNPGILVAGRIMDPVKSLEDMGVMFWAYANPFIQNTYQIVSILLFRQAYDDLTALSRMLPITWPIRTLSAVTFELAT